MMQQSQTPGDGLQSKVAGFVRSYIDATQSADPLRTEEALRWVCSGLEYLLGSLLDECDGWNGWVDGITPASDMLPDAIEVSSNVDLTIRGKAIWGERSRGPFWVEPFLSSVQIADRRDVIAGYEIGFADAARGLAKFPYEKHVRRAEWFSPTAWLFTFSKGTLSNKA
jgi:hypothetical protein